ncbi:MAG: hypothetical protein AABY22_19975 [Nanoarchaeota archaeon]
METKDIAGYAVSVVGLGVIVLSSKIAPFLSFLKTKAMVGTIIAGLALVILGIAVVMIGRGSSSYSSIKHASPEVPIYEGKGKNRKIIGYQKGED